jgi:hypothetical protein
MQYPVKPDIYKTEWNSTRYMDSRDESRATTDNYALVQLTQFIARTPDETHVTAWERYFHCPRAYIYTLP